MSKWKGDFKGFYNAGLNNAAIVARSDVRELLSEFKEAGKSNDSVEAFAKQLQARLNKKSVKKKAPTYNYTSTQGYKYHM